MMKNLPAIPRIVTVSTTLAICLVTTRSDAATELAVTEVDSDGAHAGFLVSGTPGVYGVQTSGDMDTWSDAENVEVGASMNKSFTLAISDAAPLFVRAYEKSANDVVSISTSGTDFSPEIECSGASTPDITWTFDGGTTSSAYPAATISYGTEAARTHTLTVRAPAVLAELNLGYDGGDGGSAPVNYLAAQNVTAVTFPVPLAGLKVFCASNNTGLASLDFTGFDSLEIVECYYTENLRDVKASDLPSIKRLCFENCDLESLDISGDPNLEDLRGAQNGFTRIDVGGGTGPKIWHWCTRDNPQLEQNFCDFMGDFTALNELFIWNDNQSGVFEVGSHVLTSLQASTNSFTGANLGDQPNLGECSFSWNDLASFSIGNCPSLYNLDLSHNLMDRAAIDAVLEILDTSATNLSVAYLNYNDAPTSAGMLHYQNLVNRGVTISIDQQDENDGAYDIEGGDNAVTFVTQGTTISMEIQTSSTPTSVIWHWGDGTTDEGSLTATHDFSTTAEHINYVEVVPASCVTYFGSASSGQEIKRVRNLANFPNVSFLYLYNDDVRELSIAGCAALRQLHLAANPVSKTTCDPWFIDLDAAVAGPVDGTAFYFPSAKRTSACDAAYSSLVTKGFAMYPY